MDLGVDELVDALPQEVGGTLFVASTYKNGAFVSGSANIFARMQGSIGHLLLAAAGAKAATAGTGTAATRTRFYTDPNDESTLRWLAFRKYTPASGGTDGITEYLYDAKVNAVTLNIPAVGPTGMAFSFLGRKTLSADNESATGTTYEGGEGLGQSCNGTISLPGFTAAIGGGWSGKFTSAQIVLANNLSQPQQEMIIGAYHPDDFTTLSRAASVQLVYKWEDADLYKEILYGGAAGAWSPVIPTSAVSIKTASSNDITGKTVPYSMEFVASSVDWTISKPTLAGNNLLMVQLTGLVKGTVNSTPTWYIDLVNDTDYTGV
jgi:Phage tail tube protein